MREIDPNRYVHVGILLSNLGDSRTFKAGLLNICTGLQDLLA